MRQTQSTQDKQTTKKKKSKIERKSFYSWNFGVVEQMKYDENRVEQNVLRTRETYAKVQKKNFSPFLFACE